MSLDSTGKCTVITPATHHLPNEIMALIFSFVTDSQWTLYQCTLLNRSFYELANPLLWHTAQLNNEKNATRFFKGMLDISKQRCDTLGQLIHDLQLSWCNTLDQVIHEQLLRLNYAIDDPLQDNTSFGHIDHDPIQVLHMPSLQHLKLSNCLGNNVRLLQHTRLTSVKIHNALVTKEGFDALAQCPLEDFEWYTDGTDPCHLLQRLHACPLRRLVITFLNTVQHTTNPLFAQFMMAPSTFPLLTVLEISVCPDLNDQVMTAFFKYHPLLEQLYLSLQRDITDATLDAIKLPRLTHASLIGLRHITTAAVRRLMTACPLTYLDVSYCAKVDSAGFPDFVEKRQKTRRQVHWELLMDQFNNPF